MGIDKKKFGPKMAELRTFFVNPSKIPDEPLEVAFAHCAMVSKLAVYLVYLFINMNIALMDLKGISVCLFPL